MQRKLPRLTDIICDGKSVQVRGDYHQRSISFQARMVILATGANIGLLLRIGLLKKMPLIAVATRAYFEGITGVMDQARFYLGTEILKLSAFFTKLSSLVTRKKRSHSLSLDQVEYSYDSLSCPFCSRSEEHTSELQ